MKENPDAHPKEEIEDVNRKLEEVRNKLQAAQRRASGLPQLTKEQRSKV